MQLLVDGSNHSKCTECCLMLPTSLKADAHRAAGAAVHVLVRLRPSRVAHLQVLTLLCLLRRRLDGARQPGAELLQDDTGEHQPRRQGQPGQLQHPSHRRRTGPDQRPPLHHCPSAPTRATDALLAYAHCARFLLCPARELHSGLIDARNHVSKPIILVQMGHEALFSQTGVDIVTGLESKVRRPLPLMLSTMLQLDVPCPALVTSLCGALFTGTAHMLAPCANRRRRGTCVVGMATARCISSAAQVQMFCIMHVSHDAGGHGFRAAEVGQDLHGHQAEASGQARRRLRLRPQGEPSAKRPASDARARSQPMSCLQI